MEDRYTHEDVILPQNENLSHDPYKDKILRHLDCTVIEFMHDEIYTRIKADMVAQGFSEFKIFDSTRGVFREGGPAFEGAALFEKSHIQICIQNPNVIQGFFMPRKEVDLKHLMDVERPGNSLTTAW